MMLRVMPARYLRFFGVLLVLWIGTAQAVVEISLETQEQEFSISRYQAEGEQLVLWFASGLAENERVHLTAMALAERGVEVWAVDVLENLFLPRSTESLRALDGRHVGGLIAAVHQQTGKRITVFGRGYEAISVLRGVRRWQQMVAESEQQRPYLNGVILFSPELYSTIPALGLEPVYEPITASTNIPLMIFQAGKHGNRRQLPGLIKELERGGAAVFVQVQAGVTGLFYYRDLAPETLETLQGLPVDIQRAVSLLQRVPTPTRATVMVKNTKPAHSGLDMALSPFKGDSRPPALDLRNARGQRVQRNDYRGKVTLVNFWATWCPPCVEEIPSFNRLREAMAAYPFELISVNYAEGQSRIDEFLKQVEVDFPVLLDEDGRVSEQWKVLIFPSTFVIGPDGRIAYGVNGAIHWDSPDVITQLRALMEQ